MKYLTSIIPQHSAFSCQFHYFPVPFPQLRMVLKINQKYFRTVCFSGNKKFALKGQMHEIFYFPFFFSWINQISWPKICRKLRKWSSRDADFRKKLRLRNCRVVVAELHSFKKLQSCYRGGTSFKLQKCDCGLKKKLHAPTSGGVNICVVNSVGFMKYLWRIKSR